MIACVAVTSGADAVPPAFNGPVTGEYVFTTPAGKPLTVCYAMPPGSGPDTPVVIVVPGVLRNAAEYRDQWQPLAEEHRFVVLAIEASLEHFPTEYDYNAAGAIGADGRVRPRRERLAAAIEPLFDDFRKRVGSSRQTFSLYGHSAGGTFVLAFLLLEPSARVDAAVAANPAFCVFPHAGTPYPFGVAGVELASDWAPVWFSKPLVLVLGDRDLAPRYSSLSNGPAARRQGPHVFARGLGFFHAALVESARRDAPLLWKLRIAEGVGHSNPDAAPAAVNQFLGLWGENR